MFRYFSSADGLLGCVTNIYDSTRQQYYVSLYNYDAVISNPTTYRYTCIVSICTLEPASVAQLDARPTGDQEVAGFDPRQGRHED